MSELKDRVARELEAARARTLALLEPISDAGLLAQHSTLMSPLVWDLAHIGHYEELWLLRELGAGEPTDPRFDDIYDAFRHPRSERPTLDILGPAEARDFVADVRKRSLDVLAGTDSRRRRPAARRRLRLRAGDPPRAPARRDDARHGPAHGRRAHPDAGDGPGAPGPDPAGLPLDVLVEGGPFVMGTSTDPWAYDNERPAHVVDVPAFRIDTTPVTNAAYVEFVDAGGYDDPRWWTDEGWAWRTEAGLEHPQFWIATATAWTAARFGRVEPLPPTSRCSTSAGSRPTRTPAGRARACPPKPSGRRRRAGRPTEPVAGARSRRAALRAGRGRRAPGGRQRLRLPRHARRRLGVDRERLRGLPRLPVVPRTGSTRRCSSAPAAPSTGRATRCCAAGRGPPTRSRAASRSATGTCRSGARSSPASAARPTPEPRPVCRHLAYLGPPVALRSLLFDAPHALVHQARNPRYQHAGRDNPDGWGVGWSFAGDARGEHERYRAATKMWEDTSFAGERDRDDGARRRATRRPAPSSRSATRRRSRPSTGCSRSTASCPAFATGSATSCASQVSPRRAAGDRRRHRQRGAVRAGARPARRRSIGGRGVDRRRPARAGREHRRLNLLLTDGTRSPPPRSTTRCSSHRRRPARRVRAPRRRRILDRDRQRLARRERSRHPHRRTAMTVRVDVHLAATDLHDALADDARRGLTATPKDLPPKWFYDDRGSQLFDEITRLDEYYPTRAERAILAERGRDRRGERRRHAHRARLGHVGEDPRLLLDALARAGTAPTLRAVRRERDDAARRRRARSPRSIRGSTCTRSSATSSATSTGSRRRPPARRVPRRHDRQPAAGDPRRVPRRDRRGPRARRLVPPRHRPREGRRPAGRGLRRRAGVTAAFNRNVLSVINRELGADFDPDAFDHVARWNADEEWIEMWLESPTAQTVKVPELDLVVELRRRRGDAAPRSPPSSADAPLPPSSPPPASPSGTGGPTPPATSPSASPPHLTHLSHLSQSPVGAVPTKGTSGRMSAERVRALQRCLAKGFRSGRRTDPERTEDETLRS